MVIANSGNLLSQNSFNPFNLSDTEWSIGLCDGNQPPNYYTGNYKLCGDTLLGSAKYKKIFFSLLPAGNNQPGYNLYGFFRQDSILKCNYLRLPTWTKDSLLMNYNLNVGDTVKKGHYAHVNYSQNAIIVKTDSIPINGKKIRILYTDTTVDLNCNSGDQYLGNLYTGIFFVEGLGHYYGIFITQG